MNEMCVLVIIADGQERPIAPLVDQMEKAGLTVTSVMDDLGLVRGSIGEAKLPALKALPGVLRVEEEEIVHLAPPDSPVQ